MVFGMDARSIRGSFTYLLVWFSESKFFDIVLIMVSVFFLLFKMPILECELRLILI